MILGKSFLIMMYCLYHVSLEKSPLYVFDQVVSLSSANQTVPDADLEAVLGDQVSLARCRVTCMNQFSPCNLTPMCGRCLHVCRRLVETPAWFNICSAPRLCSSGCQVACGSEAFSSPGTRYMETRSGRHTLASGRHVTIRCSNGNKELI